MKRSRRGDLTLGLGSGPVSPRQIHKPLAAVVKPKGNLSGNHRPSLFGIRRGLLADGHILW